MTKTPITQGHSPFRDGPAGWTLYVSRNPSVRRLVVFVHGFNGKPVKTWLNFPDGSRYKGWWQESDLLFFGYNSVREGIGNTANRLRSQIPYFYPTPYRRALVVNGKNVREDVDSDYEELILVGHSQGGVVVRRAQLDAAQEWDSSGQAADTVPVLMSRPAKLFSPALFGFLPSGKLGAVKAAGGLWHYAEIILHSSISFNELQPGSRILDETRKRTEALAPLDGFEALRAHIAFAEREEIVVIERYDTDPPYETIENTNHMSVCKPVAGAFERPWDFVQQRESARTVK
ncbi:hypothetical protein GGC64_006356 [Mycobacterium sp. OAS707]|uniref:esterase/lipase family protein n=1 Tax=Mycobacterium sp. OAS707 TaxID=2663822 RepID=UPI00178B560A|nr:hypothetical protein [Mycobacterium sp. OAS707]MBE1552269.1 hypothetical protein [Mycobacterium sp. OAS707]